MLIQQIVENIIDHHFIDLELIKKTMQTTNASDRKNNKRLTLIDDAMLRLMILNEWYSNEMNIDMIDFQKYKKF